MVFINPGGQNEGRWVKKSKSINKDIKISNNQDCPLQAKILKNETLQSSNHTNYNNYSWDVTDLGCIATLVTSQIGSPSMIKKSFYIPVLL